MKIQRLPAEISVTAFDALHDDAPAWREVIVSIAQAHGGGAVTQATEGTVLVGLVGCERVVKLYPPFLRDHFEFERAAIAHLYGQLRVPTPALVATGERDGWPYLVMTQLAGEPLLQTWPTLDERKKCDLLAAIGALAAQVHGLAVCELVAFAPRWGDFVSAQRAGCRRRQQRTGLPAHLLDTLSPFIAGELPVGPDVILTGEYTPMNLLGGSQGLAGMFDFGDGLVGPREYDWLGPLCFLAAGHADRCRAFMSGYGTTLDAGQCMGLLRLLLLHRYSNLRLQISVDGWERAASFEQLAATLWPF